MNTNKSHPHLPSRAPALLACFLGLVISAAPAYAGGVFSTTSGGVAIQGYDAVAYFTMETAVTLSSFALKQISRFLCSLSGPR